MIMDNILLEPINMPAPFGFDSWLTFWLILTISVINAILMVFACYKLLQVFQLGGYRVKDYFDWFKSTKFSFWGRLVMLSFLSSAALLITNVLLEDFFKYKIMTYIGLVFYLIFVTFFIINQYTAPQKKPLKYTHRMTRMVIVLGIIVFILTFMMLNFSTINIPYFDYGAVGLTPVFMPIFVLFAFFITYPFEYWNNMRFRKKAEQKLQSKKLIKIGITGSYGKTSVKAILATMLGEKYKVCATPFSFNTPMGLSKTILNDLDDADEIFIAEMGAKHVGDIRFLCDMIKPDIGILTAIGNQHLGTFGTQENIVKTKNELVLGLNKGGKVFVNLDNKYCKQLFDNAQIQKFGCSVEDETQDVFAKNIKVTKSGSTFELCFKDGKSIYCETNLLGEHNISNIILCAGVAKELGLTLEQIKNAISKIMPTPHRLALVPSTNSLVVIDDAYNGSVEGAKAAMKVLSLFDGKKVVITPGLVELGSESFNSNFQLGIDMAGVCDYVVINGLMNFEAIYNGLVFAGFKEENIYRSVSLKQAVEFLPKITNPGDVVLFENDLPDNYT